MLNHANTLGEIDSTKYYHQICGRLTPNISSFTTFSRVVACIPRLDTSPLPNAQALVYVVMPSPTFQRREYLAIPGWEGLKWKTIKTAFDRKQTKRPWQDLVRCARGCEIGDGDAARNS